MKRQCKTCGLIIRSDYPSQFRYNWNAHIRSHDDYDENELEMEEKEKL